MKYVEGNVRFEFGGKNLLAFTKQVGDATVQWCTYVEKVYGENELN